MSETRQKTAYLVARCTPEEKAAAQARAAATGMELAEYIRASVLPDAAGDPT